MKNIGLHLSRVVKLIHNYSLVPRNSRGCTGFEFTGCNRYSFLTKFPMSCIFCAIGRLQSDKISA